MNEQITPIGQVNYKHDNRIFGIKDKDRLGHIYVIGKTGTGKTTLLQNMAISDIEKGNGLAIIDPHGDISQDILNYIPEDRIEDVVYFNPADTDSPIAFNPLLNVHPEFHHLVVSGLISTFKKIWADSWGPRMEHILRYTLLTLLAYRKATLLDIQPLLTNKEFRSTVLSYVTSQRIFAFWQNEFDKYSPHFRNEVIAPILNKMGIFAASEPLRKVVQQKKRSFHMDWVMNEGKILIVNLSKGILGEDVSALLGNILITAIQVGALHRSRLPEYIRKPFYVYVDECHSFLTLSFADILAEARKYKVSLFLAHQYIDQLKEEIRSAVFGNVGTLICFRIGANDAEYLEKEFYPPFNLHDLVGLPRYHMYLKLMIDGTASEPFSATTVPVKAKGDGYKEAVIRASKRQFGQLPESMSKPEQKTLW